MGILNRRRPQSQCHVRNHGDMKAQSRYPHRRPRLQGSLLSFQEPVDIFRQKPICVGHVHRIRPSKDTLAVGKATEHSRRSGMEPTSSKMPARDQHAKNCRNFSACVAQNGYHVDNAVNFPNSWQTQAH